MVVLQCDPAGVIPVGSCRGMSFLKKDDKRVLGIVQGYRDHLGWYHPARNKDGNRVLPVAEKT